MCKAVLTLVVPTGGLLVGGSHRFPRFLLPQRLHPSKADAGNARPGNLARWAARCDDAKDVDYINPRNAHFNKKVSPRVRQVHQVL